MNRGRLEAFSDGVIAIIVTIMVLELRPPEGHHFADLHPLMAKLLVYLLSFIYVAIYWNNHHHLMQVVERIDGRVLWANMSLLFCLSLTPVGTAWLGEHPRETAPVAVYGIVLLGSAIAYFVLTRALLSVHSAESPLAIALGRDWKGKLSAAAYVVGIALAFVQSWAAIVVYIGVAVVWFVPDRRVERRIGHTAASATAADTATGTAATGE
jgi:uncharacterized membrane protein